MPAISQLCLSQIIPDMIFVKEYTEKVRSMDEFINRFNGIEDAGSIEGDTCNSINRLIKLFDYEMERNNMTDDDLKSLITGFIDRVIAENLKLNITDSLLYAEAQSSVTFHGKNYKMKLVLQSEAISADEVRWAIIGIEGLKENGIIDTTRTTLISPVEHEMHFMSLPETLSYNKDIVMGIVGNNVEIDELSVFLTMIMCGEICVNTVDKVIFHSFNIPGYHFIIHEKKGNGRNSGWLINSLSLISAEKMSNPLNILLK